MVHGFIHWRYSVVARGAERTESGEVCRVLGRHEDDALLAKVELARRVESALAGRAAQGAVVRPVATPSVAPGAAGVAGAPGAGGPGGAAPQRLTPSAPPPVSLPSRSPALAQSTPPIVHVTTPPPSRAATPTAAGVTARPSWLQTYGGPAGVYGVAAALYVVGEMLVGRAASSSLVPLAGPGAVTLAALALLLVTGRHARLRSSELFMHATFAFFLSAVLKIVLACRAQSS